MTILDDDAASTRVYLSLEPAGAREGEATSTAVTVTAELDASSRSQTTIVQLSLLLNLAADADDVALHFPNTDTIEIMSGETTASIEVSLTLTDNDIFEEDESFSILGSVVDLVNGEAIFTIMDDDVRGISVSQTTIELTEGEAKDYNVVLTSEPTADVTITLNVIEAEGVSISLSSRQLTFTPADWNTEQTLTVTADDNGHLQQPTATVTIEHLASGGGYGDAMPKRLQVVVTDDEMAPTIVLSLNQDNVNEGSGEEFLVMANLEDVAQNMPVARLTDTELGLVVPAGFILVEDPGNEQTQTILAGDISVDWTLRADVGTNNILGDTGTVTFTVTTASGLDVVPATLKIVDASPAEIVVSSSLTVSEDVMNSSYRVSLSSRPTDTVVVTVRIDGFSADSNIYLLGGENSHTLMLRFHPSDWNGAGVFVRGDVFVEIGVIGNDYSGENPEETIIHSASDGGYDGAQLKILRVVVTDNEDTPTILLSLSTEKLPEGHKGQLMVTARLEGISQMDTDLTLVLPGEEFTVNEASRAQTILAGATTAVSWFVDADVGTNTILGDTRSVTFSVTTVSGLAVVPATLKIVDASPAEIVVSSSLTVSEEAGNSSYRVSLSSRPTDTVVVTVRIDGFSADSNIYRKLSYADAEIPSKRLEWCWRVCAWRRVCGNRGDWQRLFGGEPRRNHHPQRRGWNCL